MKLEKSKKKIIDKSALNYSLQLIGKFSKQRRNKIRGALAIYRKNGLVDSIEKDLKNNTLESDMVLAAKILESPNGLKNRVIKGHKQKDIWFIADGSDKELELEISYACGILNSWHDNTLNAIETIKLLALTASVPPEDAAGAIKACAIEWGASNYLCYKLAFQKSHTDLSPVVISLLEEIDRIIGHQESPGLQYSAIENIVSNISIFSVARRHTNTQKSKIGLDFRRSQNLNNLVATPVSEIDAAAYLNRAVQTSFLDTVHAIWVLFNLQDRYDSISSLLKSTLDSELYYALSYAQKDLKSIDLPNLIKESPNESKDENSLQLYRKSAAFLEFPAICQFRNDLDCVVGLRLVSSLKTKASLRWSAERFDDISSLRQPDGIFKLDSHKKTDAVIDGFYRTYLFLRFIQDPINLSALSSEDFKFIFNNTSELDTLLLESELETMHINASDETRPLVSVLALALYRGRSSDPDVDFIYRLKLEDFIIENYAGKIPDFIESLTKDSPQIANYLTNSLDERTLQKMYRLVQSSRDASIVRREILLTIGSALNRVEYIIAAEAIETRNKVSKLKKYFDTSRMFVDSIAMRDWIEANPSAYTQQFKELLPKLTTRLSKMTNISNADTGETKEITVLEISSTFDYLAKQIANEAFQEFCTSTEFGIESYLGRRIRHNTLDGVMTDPIDGVLSKSIFTPVIAGTRFGLAINEWQASYRIYIERIRKEFLQFSGSKKPNALFDPVLDHNDSTTQRAVSRLSSALQISGSEMLPDLIIAFCWQQIDPQLEYASRRIKVEMSNHVKNSLELALKNFEGLEEQRIFAELNEAIDNVFSKVASWFRLPETGFVSATIGDLCNIIDIELSREDTPTTVTGNALETLYYGISVHRLYDCLAVLIQNANKHGKNLSLITVHAETVEIPNTNLHTLVISVISEIEPDKIEKCMLRIYEALNSTETGRDMVTEGYSGLKKVKYITRLNEGIHTVEASNENQELKIIFKLKVEIAGDIDEEDSTDRGRASQASRIINVS